MAPKIPEHLSQSKLSEDLWSIAAGFGAIWTDVKKYEILKSLQKVSENEKIGPRVAERSHLRDKRSDGGRVHAARVW